MEINLLDEFKDKKILVVGDYCIDNYKYGRPMGIAPEDPAGKALRLLGNRERINPGMAGNIATGISALGAKCYAIGVIGRNDNGSKNLIRFFEEREINYNGMVVQEGRIIPEFLRIVSTENQSIPGFQVRHDGEIEEEVNEQSTFKMMEFMSNISPYLDAVIVADYDEVGKGIINTLLLDRIRQIAKKENIPLIGDSRTNFWNFYGFTCIKPNLKESKQLYGGKADSIGKSPQEIINKLNLESILVTKDREGMEITTREGVRKSFPAFAKNVVSVDGVGDTVTCAFTLGLISGLDYVDSTKLASYAAAIAVSKPGVDVVTLEELKEFALSSESK